MDNYNSPSSESCMVENSKITLQVKETMSRWKKLKIKESIAFSQSRETIQDRNYRNETQAIDSEKQFIENKHKRVQAIKSIR